MPLDIKNIATPSSFDSEVIKIKYAISNDGQLLTQNDGYHRSLVNQFGGLTNVSKIGTIWGLKKMIDDTTCIFYYGHDRSSDYGGELASGQDLLKVIEDFESKEFEGEVLHDFRQPGSWEKNTFPIQENEEISEPSEIKKIHKPFSIN